MLHVRGRQGVWKCSTGFGSGSEGKVYGVRRGLAGCSAWKDSHRIETESGTEGKECEKAP